MLRPTLATESTDRQTFDDALQCAAAALRAEQPSLFANGRSVREETVSHRLALHLERCIRGLKRGLFVDVEFDRNGTDYKNVGDTGKNARIDVVVHTRDVSNAGNVLAIEVKWSDVDTTVHYARQKLVAYLGRPLRYQHAALVQFNKRDGSMTVEWISRESIAGAEEPAHHG